MTRRPIRLWAATWAAALLFSASPFLQRDAESQASICGSIQSRVDTAAAGSTVDLPDGCVYRETVTIAKPLTLRGGPGVEIRGSNVWTGWTKSGSYWVKGTLPTFTSGTSPCKPDTSRCKWPEQVFFDGKPLVQVASNPQSGQFAVDGSRRVILADDPGGHVVEVTVRQRWVVGKSGGVTVEDFAMKHAAAPDPAGAIYNNGHDDWTVKNNDLSWSHGINVTLGHGTGLAVIGNNIHHGGQYGVTGSRASLEVRNNNIHDNNTEDFDPYWSAGGMKIAASTRLVADGNNVHHNDWTGLWCDEACNDATFSNNRIHHNSRYGIRVEISDNAKVFGNALWENGWQELDGRGYQQSAVAIVASRDVEVYGNTLAWNNDGVVVVNAPRTTGTGGSDPKYSTVKNVHVHHNTMLATDYPGEASHYALAWVKSFAAGNIYDPLANNRGYDNSYWFAAPEGTEPRYLWDTDLSSLGAFNDTLGEERGRYLTQAEKDEAVTTNNIPASPEPVPPCTVTGGPSAETLSGTSGNDVVCAGGGNDTVNGLGGNDILRGESGNDTLVGGIGDDTLYGGLGTDTGSYSASLTPVNASLITNSATGEGLDTFSGVENLLGSPKADALTGSEANNSLNGGGGNDTERGDAGSDILVGNGGADILFGEAGDDTVNSKDGVSGNDSLDGGAGTDTKITDATEKSVLGFP